MDGLNFLRMLLCSQVISCDNQSETVRNKSPATLIKQVFGVCLVSIMGEHQREIRESERLKRKVLNALAIITCKQALC